MSDRPTACPGCCHAHHRGHCTAPNPCGYIEPRETPMTKEPGTKTDIYQRIMNLTGSEAFAGSPGDPPEARTLYYHDGAECDPKDPEVHVISPNNDGQEVWFGTPHRWDMWLRADDVRLLTRWLIIDWYIKARWLGLRRPIYYWALRRYLAAWRRRTGQDRETR